MCYFQECTSCSITFFLSVFLQRNIDMVVPLAVKAQPVEHVVHVCGPVWAEHIKGIPWLISQHWVSLRMEKKKLTTLNLQSKSLLGIN